MYCVSDRAKICQFDCEFWTLKTGPKGLAKHFNPSHILHPSPTQPTLSNTKASPWQSECSVTGELLTVLEHNSVQPLKRGTYSQLLKKKSQFLICTNHPLTKWAMTAAKAKKITFLLHYQNAQGSPIPSKLNLHSRIDAYLKIMLAMLNLGSSLSVTLSWFQSLLKLKKSIKRKNFALWKMDFHITAWG